MSIKPIVRGSVGISVLNPFGNSISAEMGIQANSRKNTLFISTIDRYKITIAAGIAKGKKLSKAIANQQLATIVTAKTEKVVFA